MSEVNDMRYKIIILAVVLFIVAGCIGRVPLYAPRRHDTKQHKVAKSTSDCLGCHDINERVDHNKEDDCFRCHKLCQEC